MTPEKTHFFDNPRNLRRVLWTFYTLCVLLLAADLIHHRHVSHPWESLLGFYALYGFVACVTLVLVAKEMRKVVMRKEDYYGKD
jgi:hypothetical protein